MKGQRRLTITKAELCRWTNLTKSKWKRTPWGKRMYREDTVSVKLFLFLVSFCLESERVQNNSKRPAKEWSRTIGIVRRKGKNGGGRIRIGDRSKGEEEKKGKEGERRKNSKGVPRWKGDPWWMRGSNTEFRKGFLVPTPGWVLYW